MNKRHHRRCRRARSGTAASTDCVGTHAARYEYSLLLRGFNNFFLPLFDARFDPLTVFACAALLSRMRLYGADAAIPLLGDG